MVYQTRCTSCGALNGEPKATPACRRCQKTGTLVPLDEDTARLYPDLVKTEQGYEAQPRPR